MLQSLRKLRIPTWTHRPVVNLRWFSDDEKSDKKKPEKSNKEKYEKPKRVIKNKEDIEKLQKLLESMPNTSKVDIKIQTAPKKEKPEPKVEANEEKQEANMKKITESIAKKMGGDVKQTEADLLRQLLGIKDLKQPGNLSDLITGMKVDMVDADDKQKLERNREPRRSDSDSNRRGDGDFNRRGDGDSYRRGDGDFNRQRDGDFNRQRDGGSNRQRDGGSNRRADGGSNRRADGDFNRRADGDFNRRADGDFNRRADGDSYPRRNERDSYSRADNVRNALGPSRDRNTQRRSEPAPQSGVVDLFGGKELGIFTKASTAKDPLETWSKLEQRELKLAVTHPPHNYFEKMILWTDQGKLWKFPIDNEDGWDEEKATDFSEHILLEMHLDGWCPTSGPVRHFMELVCVGLSKNHYLSAKEKKDHIMWYQGYFEEKKDLLGDLMTLGKAPQPQVEAN